MTHLGMWNELEKTDPKYTKQFSRSGGFKGTAINGTYITKRLTEKFGPNGVGWRFVLEDEQIHEGHTLKSGDKARVHVVRGHIEYLYEGEWAKTSPQFGQTMLVDDNKYGTFTDEEAPKKSITDCVSKCAVLLGVGADVHLGLFDDSKYVNDRKREEAAKDGGKDEKKDDGIKGNVVQAKKAFDELMADIGSCEDEDSLTTLLGADRTKNLIARMRVVIPEWMSGGKDIPSFEQRVERQKKYIQERQAA